MVNMEMVIDSIQVGWWDDEDQRVVILKRAGRHLYLPIWTGPAEGDAIAMRLQGITASRPQTHDFVCPAIDALGGRLESVVSHSHETQTLHANVVIGTKRGQKEADYPPSDAMAIAVRKSVPILADE